ncbi:MAG TPA: ABC transporter ATP-binding protein [Spirochaetales bacterium]|nr:ABC transporter ATP-binding protein [Spirochaetales bacterium]
MSAGLIPATNAAPERAPALELRSVVKHFPLRSIAAYGKAVHAMDDVSLTLEAGGSLALVGESGSGKTTTASVIARLYERDSGELIVAGLPARPFRGRAESLAYKKRVQLIFQDPFGSLNPTHTIRSILERPFLIHGLADGKADLEARLSDALEQVGLSPASEYLRRFPHELSGGQRQRVNIARTFAVEPSIVLADEPTSMLDVSIRMGVMNMMLDLKERKGVSYLYITHDLAGARYMCGSIAVMYAGMIMEMGPTDEVIRDAVHPYVRLLKSASPSPEAGLVRTPLDAGGEIPSLIDPPPGCRFHPRCPYAEPRCRESVPGLADLGGGRRVRCVLALR